MKKCRLSAFFYRLKAILLFFEIYFLQILLNNYKILFRCAFHQRSGNS
jgi:hypothetical protein